MTCIIRESTLAQNAFFFFFCKNLSATHQHFRAVYGTRINLATIRILHLQPCLDLLNGCGNKRDSKTASKARKAVLEWGERLGGAIVLL